MLSYPCVHAVWQDFHTVSDPRVIIFVTFSYYISSEFVNHDFFSPNSFNFEEYIFIFLDLNLSFPIFWTELKKIIIAPNLIQVSESYEFLGSTLVLSFLSFLYYFEVQKDNTSIIFLYFTFQYNFPYFVFLVFLPSMYRTYVYHRCVEAMHIIDLSLHWFIAAMCCCYA